MGREGAVMSGPGIHELPQRFTVHEALGEGFTGRVWRASDALRGGQSVAVKTLSRGLYEKHGLPFPPQETALLRESAHPNVVALLDVVEDDLDRVLLVQEHLCGGDLFSCMLVAGLLSEFVARLCFGDLVAALCFLHGRGICHRDVKPENCVLDRHGTLKLVDFGLAARFEPGQLLRDYCGSREYAAPEVLRERPHEGPPADMWAAGVLLYDMLMGGRPFAECGGDYSRLEVDCDMTGEVQHLLRMLLREEPRHRASAEEARRAPWMMLRAAVGPHNGMELVSRDGRTAQQEAAMELPEDSALWARMHRERSIVLTREMGFQEDKMQGD